MNVAAARKNKELAALHFVWCSGACGTPLTKDIVDEAIRNTDRLIKKFNGQQGNRAWQRLNDYPDDQAALTSAWKNHNAELITLRAELAARADAALDAARAAIVALAEKDQQIARLDTLFAEARSAFDAKITEAAEIVGRLEHANTVLREQIARLGQDLAFQRTFTPLSGAGQ